LNVIKLQLIIRLIIDLKDQNLGKSFEKSIWSLKFYDVIKRKIKWMIIKEIAF